MIYSLKEFKLINHITRTLPNKYIGDDCAYLGDLPNLIISVDTFVEDIHFSFRYSSIKDVAIKTLNASFSDIAAMGGKPKYFLLSISAKNLNELKKFVAALKEPMEKLSVKIIGGDTTYSEKFTVSMTVLGEAPKPILRSGTKVGDLIYLSSYTGLSGAGLFCLQKNILGFNFLKRKHKRPKARVDFALKVNSFANSMIDISDGLLSELYHLANDSYVDICLDKIPLHKQLISFEKQILGHQKSNTAEDFALFGGEDYELLYTIPEKLKAKALGLYIGKVLKKELKNSKVIYKGQTLNINEKQFKHF